MVRPAKYSPESVVETVPVITPVMRNCTRPHRPRMLEFARQGASLPVLVPDKDENFFS